MAESFRTRPCHVFLVKLRLCYAVPAVIWPARQLDQLPLAQIMTVVGTQLVMRRDRHWALVWGELSAVGANAAAFSRNSSQRDPARVALLPTTYCSPCHSPRMPSCHHRTTSGPSALMTLNQHSHTHWDGPHRTRGERLLRCDVPVNWRGGE